MSQTITIPIPMNASANKPITPRQWRWFADIEEAEHNLANAALMRSVADALEGQS